MKARAVIRDVGRVLDVPLAEVNRLCSLIPANPGKPTTLAEARRDVKELADALRDNETYRRLFDLGERLEGVSRHAGVHAAGVLIAPRPLVEYLPLYRNSNDEITTQFEMKSVDRMGLLKMDFLGLITLTILDDALAFVEKKTGARPDLATIPLDDPEVFRLFADGRTDGVFQFESSGMRDLLRRVRPERLRGPRGPERPLPAGRAGRGDRRGLHRAPPREEVRLPASAARADPQGDVRRSSSTRSRSCSPRAPWRATRPARRTSSARRSARRTTRSSRPRATSS